MSRDLNVKKELLQNVTVRVSDRMEKGIEDITSDELLEKKV